MSSPNLNAAPILNDVKEKYFKKLSISNFLGGFKFSDEDNNLEITLIGYVIQIFWYLILPIVIIVLGFIGKKDDNLIVFSIISGSICMILVLIWQFYILSIYKKSISDNADIPGLGLTENQQMLVQIFKPKNNKIEFGIVLVLAFLFAFSGSAFIITEKDDNMILVILGFFSILFGSFSLSAESPRENFSMTGDNNTFNLYSTLYNRAYYFIIFAFLAGILEIKIMSYFVAFLWLIWFLGFLGPIFATFIYGIEKYNYWIFGFQTSVSDLRSIFWALQHSMAAMILFALYPALDSTLIVAFAAVLGIIMSENIALKIGFAFSYTESAKQQKKKMEGIEIGWKIGFIIVACALGFVTPMLKFDENMAQLLMIISLAVFLILKCGEYFQSAYIFGIFRSLFKNQFLSDKFMKFMHQINQILAIMAISAANFVYFDKEQQNEDNLKSFEKFIVMALTYRGYKHLFSDQQSTYIIFFEIILLNIAMAENTYYYTIWAPFLTVFNDFLAKFLRRGNIWLYQIVKMVQDKKQRIKKTNLFIILTFTLFLPLNLMALILSSALDTPFVPFLGLPLFFFGFPRPKRMWPKLMPVVQMSGESMLYNKFLINFQHKLKQIVPKYQHLFVPGKSFLIRIDKYLATLSILESSREHLVIHLTGSESQDPVSCHSHEATAVDDLVKEAFEEKKSNIFKNFNGSVIPITQFESDGYEENQIKLTGIIEDSEFKIGFQEIYLKMIVYFIKQYISKNDKEMLYVLTANIEEYIDIYEAKKRFPTKWAKFIELNCENRETPLIKLKTKLIDDKVPLHNDSKPSKNNNNMVGDNFILPQQQSTGKKVAKNNNDFDDFFNQKQTQQPLNNNIVEDNNNRNNRNRKSINKNNTIQHTNNLEDDFLQELGINPNEEEPQQQQQQVQIQQKQNNNYNNHHHRHQIQQQKSMKHNNEHQIEAGEIIDQNSYKNPSQINGAQQMGQSNVFSNPSQVRQFKNNNSNNNNQNENNYNNNIANLNNNNQNEVLNMSNEISMDKIQKQKAQKQQTNNNKNDIDEFLDSYDLNNNNQTNDPIKPQSRQKRQRRHINDQFNSQPTQNQNNEVHIQDQFYQSNNEKKDQQQVQQLNPRQQTIQSQVKEDAEVIDMLEDLDDILAPGPPPPPPMFNNLDFDKQSENTRNSENNMPSPNDRMETTFMQKIKQLTSLIYALSLNDLQFNNAQLNKGAMYQSYNNQSLLKKCRIFQSLGGKKQAQNYEKIYEIQKLAIRYAIKIAQEQQSIMMTTEMSDEELKEAIDENIKECYIGMGNEKEWQIASQQNVETLWNLHYFENENTLGVFISKYKTIKCSLLQLNEDIVDGIWANLMFELYYVSNDDDERYSIQTHKNFLRNIIIENSQQPLGYAPFYSGPLVVNT